MKKDRNELGDIKARVKVNNIFPNLIATKNLDLNKFKFVGKNYKKTPYVVNPIKNLQTHFDVL